MRENAYHYLRRKALPTPEVVPVDSLLGDAVVIVAVVSGDGADIDTGDVAVDAAVAVDVLVVEDDSLGSVVVGQRELAVAPDLNSWATSAVVVAHHLGTQYC